MLRFAALVTFTALCAACASNPGSASQDDPESRYSPENVERQMVSLLEKFDRFDYNGDGYLTRMEIQDGVRDLEADPLDPARFEKAFLYYDQNQDQRISLEEANIARDRGPGPLAD